MGIVWDRLLRAATAHVATTWRVDMRTAGNVKPFGISAQN